MHQMIDLVNRLKDPMLPKFTPDQQILILLIGIVLLILSVWRYEHLY